MPEKKKDVMVEFEGNIFGESEKAYFVTLEIPAKYSEMKLFPPKSVLVRPSIRNGEKDEEGFLKSGFITGKVPFWCFKKIDKELKDSVAVFPSDVEYKEIVGDNGLREIRKKVEVIQPSKESLMTQSRKELMKTEYEGFVGDTPLITVMKEINDGIWSLRDTIRDLVNIWKKLEDTARERLND